MWSFLHSPWRVVEQTVSLRRKSPSIVKEIVSKRAYLKCLDFSAKNSTFPIVSARNGKAGGCSLSRSPSSKTSAAVVRTMVQTETAKIGCRLQEHHSGKRRFHSTPAQIRQFSLIPWRSRSARSKDSEARGGFILCQVMALPHIKCACLLRPGGLHAS
jgi:hypothetical protein